MEIAVAVDAISEVAPSPRKSRRLSNRSTNASADGENRLSSKKPSLTRFGFKKRALPVVAIAVGDEESVQADGAAAQSAPVDLVGMANSTFGNLDAVDALLCAKVNPKAKTFDEYKVVIVQLQERVTGLKAALAEQLKHARRLGPEVLAPMQEEINGRLRALADDASAEQTAADRANEELASVRMRCEERSKRVVEMREAAEMMKVELAAHEERANAEGARADAKETQLRARDAELKSAKSLETELRAEIEGLKASNAQQSAQNAEAAEAAETAHTAISSELDATRTALEDCRAAAEQTEGELTAARDAETVRADKAEKELATTSTELDALKGTYSDLTKQHGALSESAAATRARLESVQVRHDLVTSANAATSRRAFSSVCALACSDTT